MVIFRTVYLSFIVVTTRVALIQNIYLSERMPTTWKICVEKEGQKKEAVFALVVSICVLVIKK